MDSHQKHARIETRGSVVDVIALMRIQDPYHGPDQAEGWSFSVPRGQRVPPSLQNIYKEIAQDVGGVVPKHGHLEHWVQQGVLLINTSLTVRVRPMQPDICLRSASAFACHRKMFRHAAKATQRQQCGALRNLASSLSFKLSMIQKCHAGA